MEMSHCQIRAPRPIFIVGAPRSGTSIMNWAIGQHPNIQPMPETVWISTYVMGAFTSFQKGSEREKFSHLSNVGFPFERFMQQVALSIDAIVHDVFEERCQTLYGDYHSRGIRINPENPNAAFQIRRSPEDPKLRWIDGTPLNTQFAWALAQVFPEARFIHNLRNPVDVALSLENFDRVGAESQEMEEGLNTWMYHTENAWRLEQALGPDRVFRLDFGRIEAEPQALLRDVLAFLGEQFSADCLKPLRHRTNSSETEDKRDSFLNRFKCGRLTEEVDALYQALGQPISPEAREESARILADRFYAHLAERPLL